MLFGRNKCMGIYPLTHFHQSCISRDPDMIEGWCLRQSRGVDQR